MEMFNALKYTKRLEEVGFTREQAEAHVQMVIEVMDSNFATKSDFKELETRIDSKFNKLESQIAQLEYKLMVKLGVLLSTIMTLGFTAVSLVIKFH
jgi:hypothetical protein